MAKRIFTLTVTPTITAGAYSAADNVGGLLKFKGLTEANQFSHSSIVKITGIALGDAAKQDTATDIVFYKSKPASTFTDNAAQVISDADLPLILHVENITAYDDFSANSVATVQSIAVNVPHSDAIYASLITRGTPTYVATSDLDITLTIEVED